MSLLAAFLTIAQEWRSVFPQQRTFERGVRQALGSLVCLGRRRDGDGIPHLSLTDAQRVFLFAVIHLNLPAIEMDLQ